MKPIVRFFTVPLVALLVFASANAAVQVHRPFASGARATSAYTETVLHRFGSFYAGSDPLGIMADSFGRLYGITMFGGLTGPGCINGCGLVFKLTPQGSRYIDRTLFEFQGTQKHDVRPAGGLLRVVSGDFFGAVDYEDSTYAGGFVFRLTPTQLYGLIEQDLYDFQGSPSDAGSPTGKITTDAKGALYGAAGGGSGCVFGCGTIYKLTPKHNGYSESVIYFFEGAADGMLPLGGLVVDKAGNLYGTAQGSNVGCQNGNPSASACGVVFELSPQASGGYSYSALYTFEGGNDGHTPNGDLLRDAAGNLYGTTVAGGAKEHGTVYKLTPQSSGTYTETVLYRFQGGSDGSAPIGGVIADTTGNLFGVTQYGGTGVCKTSGCGTGFELTPGSNGYSESVLYSFTNHPDGAYPNDTPLLDQNDDVFGTTRRGGKGRRGTVFELVRPSHHH